MKPSKNHCPISENYFSALTGLRFVLIMIIVYYHGYALFGPAEPGRIDMFFRNYGGVMGNCAFFTISGFLLSNVYHNRVISDGMSFLQFMKRRLLTLYPLYFITVCCGVGLSFIWSRFEYVNFQNIFLDMMMLSSGWFGTLQRYNSPLWFACVTMQCYMVFYVLCYFSRKHTNIFLYGTVALILLGYAMRIGLWMPPLANTQTAEGVHSFFIGCLIWYIYHNTSKKTVRSITFAGAAWVILTMLLSVFWGFLKISGGYYLFFSALLSPVLLLLCLEWKPAVYVFGSNIFKKLGAISISIYMWHYLLYDALYWGAYQFGRFFNYNPWYVRAGIYCVLLFLICALSRCYIEGKLGNYLKHRLLSAKEITDPKT